MSLLKNLKEARSKERSATYVVLKYLSQVNKTKLHLKLGYSSLYKFLIKELGYSEGEAVTRVSALKLMMKVPLIESKIKEGEINLVRPCNAGALATAYAFR